VTATDTSLFERSVSVARIGAGRYAAEVDPAWSGPVAPNGGVLAASMVRAAEVELGPGAPPVRTVAAHYLEAPAAGALQLGVEVLRRGKRVCATDVRMFQAERLVAQATIVSSAPRAQEVGLAGVPPAAPAPAQVVALDGDRLPLAPPVFRQLELRPVFGGLPFTAGEEAEGGGWMAIRDDGALLDPARLCALCDLWWPAVFPLLSRPVAVPTIQLTVHLRALAEPVAPPVLARFRTRTIAEGHLEETGELWSTDGVLLAESSQLALLSPSVSRKTRGLSS
jgi:acyl-CoA thioesterase